MIFLRGGFEVGYQFSFLTTTEAVDTRICHVYKTKDKRKPFWVRQIKTKYEN